MASPLHTRKTRLLLVSDTHANANAPSRHSTYPFHHPLPKADILIHSGDLTIAGSYNDNLTTRDFILKHPAELKIVIPGNHDLTLDSEYMAAKKVPYLVDQAELHSQNLARIRELWTGEEAKKHGIVYLEEGVKIFTLAHGTSFSIYASAYTPEFCGWAFPYPRSEDRFNPPQDSISTTGNEPLNPIPSATSSSNIDSESSFAPGVDIMITHGPPLGIHDWALGGRTGGSHVGCAHLRRAVRRCRPRLHVFGHIHEGYGATRIGWGSELGPGDEKGENANDRLMEIRMEKSYGEAGESRIDLSRSADPNEGALRAGNETLFVNASMLTVSYRAENHPWIVDLELPLIDVKDQS